jgi:hypothetical protein
MLALVFIHKRKLKLCWMRERIRENDLPGTNSSIIASRITGKSDWGGLPTSTDL